MSNKDLKMKAIENLLFLVVWEVYNECNTIQAIQCGSTVVEGGGMDDIYEHLPELMRDIFFYKIIGVHKLN